MKDRIAARPDCRRNVMIASARAMFLRNGYAATTMSAIAAELGGSKSTLWRYFSNKELLFAAVLDEMVERYGEALRTPLPQHGDPADVLRASGIAMMHTITQPEIISLHRLVIAEGGRAGHLGSMLWARGPAQAERRLKIWLADQMEKGGLRTADPLVAARHFIGLCQSGHYLQHLVGAIESPEASAIEADVDAAVAVFMMSYAEQRRAGERFKSL